MKALADAEVRGMARWVIVGEQWVLQQASPTVPWKADAVVDHVSEIPDDAPVTLLQLGAIRDGDFRLAEVSAAAGRAALDYVAAATHLCLEGLSCAMVTAPINKEAVTLSGRQFTGHTEYIAELCGADESRMLLVNDKMRVIHVTTHCALAEATQVGVDRVVKTIQLGHDAMLRLGWERPRLAICGLNPHAGENGLFGSQEAAVIAPAVAEAQRTGIDCSGPFPADTLFMQAHRGRYDMVVAMYHDQGHVPMKLLDFEHTVNVSLGLPIVRTSVDHGTAFDIAGRNVADPEDMKTAMRLALQLGATSPLAKK